MAHRLRFICVHKAHREAEYPTAASAGLCRNQRRNLPFTCAGRSRGVPFQDVTFRSFSLLLLCSFFVESHSTHRLLEALLLEQQQSQSVIQHTAGRSRPTKYPVIYELCRSASLYYIRLAYRVMPVYVRFNVCTCISIKVHRASGLRGGVHATALMVRA